MARRHQFHVAHDSHSITVTVRRGHGRDIELLVDGKEVGFMVERASDVVTLASVIVDDPPQFFRVRVEHLRRRAGGPPARRSSTAPRRS